MGFISSYIDNLFMEDIFSSYNSFNEKTRGLFFTGIEFRVTVTSCVD